jgi:hypothetical protein
MGKYSKRNSKKSHQSPANPQKTRQSISTELYHSPTDVDTGNARNRSVDSLFGHDPGPPVLSISAMGRDTQATYSSLPNLPTSSSLSAPPGLPIPTAIPMSPSGLMVQPGEVLASPAVTTSYATPIAMSPAWLQATSASGTSTGIPAWGTLSSLSSVTATTPTCADGRLSRPPIEVPPVTQGEYVPQSTSSTSSVPLSPNAVQRHREDKRPSARASTPCLFGPPKSAGRTYSPQSLLHVGGGVQGVEGSFEGSLALQQVLMDDVVARNEGGVQTSMSTPPSSLSDRPGLPGSVRFSSPLIHPTHNSSYLRDCGAIVSLRLDPRCVSPAVSNQTMAQYVSANDLSSYAIPQAYESHVHSPIGLSQTPRIPFSEEAHLALRRFFRAAGDVIPLDLSDTTFLPTPPAVPDIPLEVCSPLLSPINSTTSPPPSYRHNPPSHSDNNTHVQPSLSPEVLVFTSSSESSVPSCVPVLEVSWNVLRSVLYALNLPIDHETMERVKRHREMLHDRYKLLIQDMG